MSRPCCRRRIAGQPAASVFGPKGVPARELESITMTLDEFEAIRLADLNGLYQEQGADRMGVSRTTFSRILESARKKLADGLVHGKTLRIEGGSVQMTERRCCNKHDHYPPGRRVVAPVSEGDDPHER